MQLKCSRRRVYQEFDHSAFAVIKADQKYVIGILPNGEEWFLPNRSTVKAIGAEAVGFMQVSNSVLVANCCVLAVSGNCKNRLVHTPVGTYRLSRTISHAPFVAAARLSLELLPTSVAA